jgi:hypothetical protein
MNQDRIQTDPQANITCLVTIHGIGFQQAPDDAGGVAGYADALHQRLHQKLHDLLSDDPNRAAAAPHAPGERGVIYVQSSWPPGQAPPGVRSVEEGLRRLGSRATPRSTTLDTHDSPLVEDAGRRIAHVALVYTPAEETGPDVSSTLEMAAQGIVSMAHYIKLRNAVRELGADVGAVLRPPPVAVATGDAGNQPRQDPIHREGLVRRLLDHLHRAHPGTAGAGPLQVLRTVEDDVAGYVARNDLRQRVRDFVHEALTRLAQRGDVANIVINSHSQGTVVAFDTLRTLPYEVIDLVAAYFTLGSPLRKYAEALNWGRDTGRLAAMPSWAYGEVLDWGRGPAGVAAIPAWTNMWDPRDPVADPLVPAPRWRPGDSPPESAAPGLFLDTDLATGATTPHLIEDVNVDNVGHVGGGGLRAHDYWGNADEVVPRLADRLRTLATSTAASKP